MEIDKDKILFNLGTAFLISALFELTLLPFCITSLFPHLQFQALFHTKISGALYLATFIFWTFSKKYFRNQVLILILAFLFYGLFQYAVKLT